MKFETYYKKADGSLNKAGNEEHKDAETAIKSIKAFMWKERYSLVDVTLEGTNRLIISRPKGLSK